MAEVFVMAVCDPVPLLHPSSHPQINPPQFFSPLLVAGSGLLQLPCPYDINGHE